MLHERDLPPNMPLFTAFSSTAARALGITNGIGPGIPTIAQTSSTALTVTLSITPVLGSYNISYFEYSLNGGAYTGSISGSATSFTISSLVPSTSYSVKLRAVDAAGQVGPESTSASASTSAEVANSAPSITLTQLESTGTPINATRLTWSFAASSGGTYSVSTYEYRLWRGTTSGTEITSGWTTTPMNPSTSYTLTGLLHNQLHTIQVRAISLTSGLAGTAGSTTATTDTEIVASAPSISVSTVNTIQATIAIGTASSGGTYGVSYYEWRTKNSSGTVVNSGTLSTSTTTLTVNVGVSPNANYTAEVRAIMLTSGSGSSYGTASGQLNPERPTVGTLSWDPAMTTSTYGTASLYMPAPAYATSATLVMGGNTYATTVNGSGNFAWSIGSLSHNATYSFYAYVTNRIGESSSSNSNTRTWVTPKKNEYWNSGFIQPNPIFFSNPQACTSEFRYVFGDVPNSDNEVGYIRVTSVSVDGIQSFEAFDIPTTANTTYLSWVIPNGGYTLNLTNSGFSPNWGTGTYTTRTLSGLSIGGNSLDNQVWQILTSLGSRNGDCSVNPSVGGTGSYNLYKMKNFIIAGVQTTAGSLS